MGTDFGHKQCIECDNQFCWEHYEDMMQECDVCKNSFYCYDSVRSFHSCPKHYPVLCQGYISNDENDDDKEEDSKKGKKKVLSKNKKKDIPKKPVPCCLMCCTECLEEYRCGFDPTEYY